MADGRRWMKRTGVLLALAVVFAAGWLVAKTGMGSAMDPARLPEIERQFVEQMRNAALVGRFTIAGREDRGGTADRYDIYGVDKVGDHQWRFNAKIGESGVTLPVVVTMKFVDDTPMILLTDAAIPGLGTFGTRVFFYKDLYAGTWWNTRHGGHMFGRIERQGAVK